jgi:hypothetical protein
VDCGCIIITKIETTTAQNTDTDVGKAVITDCFSNIFYQFGGMNYQSGNSFINSATSNYQFGIEDYQFGDLSKLSKNSR